MIVPSIINCNLLSSQLAVKRSVIVSVYSWYLEVEIKPLLSRDLERKFEKKKRKSVVILNASSLETVHLEQKLAEKLLITADYQHAGKWEKLSLPTKSSDYLLCIHSLFFASTLPRSILTAVWLCLFRWSSNV